MARSVFKRIAVVAVLFSVASNSLHALAEPQQSALAVREAVWQAALRALTTQALTIHRASPEEGKILTEFAPLREEIVTNLLPLGEKKPPPEYRYAIDIGSLSRKGTRLSVKAEVREPFGHEQDAAAQLLTTTSSALSKALEHAFVQAFTDALGQTTSE